jgi:hypothetical protein
MQEWDRKEVPSFGRKTQWKESTTMTCDIKTDIKDIIWDGFDSSGLG